VKARYASGRIFSASVLCTWARREKMFRSTEEREREAVRVNRPRDDWY
jgi:hypothetical protein